MRPNLHLVHLPGDIERRGLLVETTEIFGCFNAAFRLYPAPRNHQAHIRDTAIRLGDRVGFNSVSLTVVARLYSELITFRFWCALFFRIILGTQWFFQLSTSNFLRSGTLLKPQGRDQLARGGLCMLLRLSTRAIFPNGCSLPGNV